MKYVVVCRLVQLSLWTLNISYAFFFYFNKCLVVYDLNKVVLWILYLW